MKKLWLRISLTFLLLLVCVLIAIGFFVGNIMKSTFLDMTRNQLTENAQLVMKVFDISHLYDQPDLLQEKIRQFANPIRQRVTIIDESGEVLADSENNPETMKNHANRPEVKEVIQEGKSQGESIRYSATQGFNMMYVTTPLYNGNERIGVVRTAISLETIDKATKKLWVSLFSILGVTLVLSGLVSMSLAKGITRPIEEIMKAARRLSKKDYSSRVKVRTKGEIGQLSSAINVLASSLQRQMEEIQENQQQLTSILSNMVSGVMLVNYSGKIQLVNPAMEKFLEQQQENLVGRCYEETGENFGLSERIERCMKEGEHLHEELHVYRPKERILDAHLAPYLGEQKEMKGVIIVLHDITDIRRLEKMRSEFVANVSHELKTPITSVKGFAETLLDGAMYDEELCRSFLKIIYDESDRLHRLISDILHLSKIEHHLLPLQLEMVNVAKLINETVETLQEEITKKEISISLPEAKNVYVEGEKDRVRQIILNLVSNGIVYTPKGGKIEVNLLEKEKEIDLIVRDTGIGIPKKDIPRIFERFYRVDKARSRHSGGTGLGLAIVKHLVESHKGQIQVDSVEGKGTTFTITLPKKQDDMHEQ
ncbi:PAS domain-containing sensor histidine kinase [Pueribacillus theae]|uniref:histidine kinase n=1 Tax=Pueribacillus theae TaxID=2171751 RepID=A0A2U1K161_9BACI|nr:ATP-binding protein [Pueribacillus theae]PWA11237.1 PAS domain-containing sensor histidine kinase [Pueribacillus theae]